MIDMGLFCQSQTAGYWRPDHFMAADRDTVGSRTEIKRLRMIDKWQNHSAQCRIAMNVILSDRMILHDFIYFFEIIDCSGHGGTDIGKNNRGYIAVNAYGFGQILIVNFAVIAAFNHNVAGTDHP